MPLDDLATADPHDWIQLVATKDITDSDELVCESYGQSISFPRVEKPQVRKPPAMRGNNDDQPQSPGGIESESEVTPSSLRTHHHYPYS